MARKINERSLANLAKGVPIQEQPNANHGRYPDLANVLKSIPPDAQERIYSVLWSALRVGSVKEAATYLKKEAENLPEHGMVFQVAIRDIVGKNGLNAIMAILDRLFGKPKIKAEVNSDVSVSGVSVIVGDKDTAEKLNKILGQE